MEGAIQRCGVVNAGDLFGGLLGLGSLTKKRWFDKTASKSNGDTHSCHFKSCHSLAAS